MKKKICIVTQPEVIDTVGGAITSFICISNLLAENYEVCGVCYSPKNGNPPSLSDNVKFVNLYNYYENTFSFSSAINSFIGNYKPDLIMFFFPYLYVQAQLLEKYNSIPRILLFRSRPDIYFAVNKNTEQLENLYTNTISQILFPSYFALLPEYIKKDNKVVCIPNPTKKSIKFIDSNIEKKKIIYLSRIDCWKGHEFLIKSFALIALKYKDWEIDIYGQSQPLELQEKLTKLVKSLKLENQIHFCGVTNEPFETYLKYDFCAFPSYFEGFPNGLSEALSVGLPAVGFKGASGVNELIIDNKNGFLTEETYQDFADKIEVLINDKSLRSKFSEEAKNMMKKYDYEQIKSLWINLVSNVLSGNSLQLNSEFCSAGCEYDLFSIEKLLSMQDCTSLKYNNLFERIFSIKTILSNSKYKKVLTIFGIKITFKRKG